MLALENLLNILYKDMPVSKQALSSICSFYFLDSIAEKKRVFDLLDEVALNEGHTLIKNISIYNLNGQYRLKLLINTIA